MIELYLHYGRSRKGGGDPVGNFKCKHKMIEVYRGRSRKYKMHYKQTHHIKCKPMISEIFWIGGYAKAFKPSAINTTKSNKRSNQSQATQTVSATS